jgi:hypothetical chaperone protein
LGQPILRESRVLGGQRTTLLEVISGFLQEVKRCSEKAFSAKFETVLSGRPVRFHSRSPAYNSQAEVDLREAYLAAGFTDVQFLPEPEAAALASGGLAEGYGLVVDIGGGTSDYSVFRGLGDAIEIVANHGIRLGGTDFDRLLNIDRVMPQLGMGSMLRDTFGPGQNEAPRSPFNDLATWEKIPFQYSAQHIRQIQGMAKQAVEPGPWRRLVEVLELELGHDIAHAVEHAKIAANGTEAAAIDMGFLKAGASIHLDAEVMARVLRDAAEEIGAAALEAVHIAALKPDDIRRVVMVGGSSLLAVVETEIRNAFPKAQLERSDAFTAIVDGLAIAAARLE